MDSQELRHSPEDKSGFFYGYLIVGVAFIIMFVLWGTFYAFGVRISSGSPIIAGLFGLSSHGLILGVIAFSFLLGGAVGPLLFGHIFDVTGSYEWGFLVCVAMSFVGLILTAGWRNVPGKVRPSSSILLIPSRNQLSKSDLS